MSAIGHDVDRGNERAPRSERIFIRTEIDAFVILALIIAAVTIGAAVFVTVDVILGVMSGN